MTYPNDPVDQVREGMVVYGSDGEPVGDVGEVGIGLIANDDGEQLVAEERSFFRVRRGSDSDLYLPSKLVEQVSADRITLQVEHDASELSQYSTRPGAAVRAPDEPGERDLRTTLL